MNAKWGLVWLAIGTFFRVICLLLGGGVEGVWSCAARILARFQFQVFRFLLRVFRSREFNKKSKLLNVRHRLKPKKRKNLR
jgi:hypothetical protein